MLDKNINLRSLYKYLIFILFAFTSTISIFFTTNNVLNKLVFLLNILALTLGIIYTFCFFNNKTNIIYFLFLFILILFWGRNYLLFNIICYVVAFIPLYSQEIISFYEWSSLIQLLLGIILSICGILPIRNYLTNTITLGFINENGLGMVLCVFTLTFLIEGKDKHLFLTDKKYKYVFLILILCIEGKILQDFTAIAILLVFIGLGYVFQKNNSKSLIGIITLVIPSILCYIAVYISKNFTFTSNFWKNLNNIITLRPMIWNHYYLMYPHGPMPIKWLVDRNYVGGAIDGTYIYLYIFEGYIFLILFVTILTISNFLLALQEDYILLAGMIAFEIGSFVENIGINYGQSFLIIVGFLSLNYSWLRMNNLKDSPKLYKRRIDRNDS